MRYRERLCIHTTNVKPFCPLKGQRSYAHHTHLINPLQGPPSPPSGELLISLWIACTICSLARFHRKLISSSVCAHGMLYYCLIWRSEGQGSQVIQISLWQWFAFPWWLMVLGFLIFIGCVSQKKKWLFNTLHFCIGIFPNPETVQQDETLPPFHRNVNWDLKWTSFFPNSPKPCTKKVLEIVLRSGFLLFILSAPRQHQHCTSSCWHAYLPSLCPTPCIVLW